MFYYIGRMYFYKAGYKNLYNDNDNNKIIFVTPPPGYKITLLVKILQMSSEGFTPKRGYYAKGRYIPGFTSKFNGICNKVHKFWAIGDKEIFSPHTLPVCSLWFYTPIRTRDRRQNK